MGFFGSGGDRGDHGDLGPPPDPFRIRTRDPRLPISARWLGIAAAAAMLFILADVAKSAYVDWLWFDSTGFGGVFRTTLAWKAGLFTSGFVLAALVIGANIWVARRIAPRGPEESFIEEVEPGAIRRTVTVLLIAVTLFAAVIFGSAAASAWENLLLWSHGSQFGVTEPAFGKDVSFYLFTLPTLHFVQGWALGLVVVSALGAGAVYALTFSLQGFVVQITREVRIHLSILAGLLLLLIAVGSWLAIFDLATSTNGAVVGATYTDVHARVQAHWLMVGIGGFAAAVTVVSALLSTTYRFPVFLIGLWALTSIVGGFAYPSFVQSFSVDPNALEKEQPYIARNIEFTRMAFGLDKIEVVDYPASPTVTAEDMTANAGTVANIRLHDPRPLKDTFNQIQSIRPLYVFNDVDIDRYTLGPVTRQLVLAARELDLNRAQASTGSGWTRERLQLTHGYGAVVAPVNEITPEGLPNLLTQDIPPIGEQVPISADGARIYFGEMTNHTIVVDTNVAEFDYPQGADFVETRYAPDRGIRLNGFVRRLALAWQLGDTNLLISGQLGEGSRVLMHRSLAQRIPHIAPFLTLDADPYLVIDDKRLVWIQDAYTSSDKFPYSQPARGVNYIRNSVKIVVDAATGDTTFYLMDPSDPIATAWQHAFPTLFTAADRMPASIRAHLRYPETLFRIQSDRYLAYHITNPQVFFVGEDLWNVPNEKFHNQEQPVDPYYVMMKLPGEQREEFALVLPFTPRNKQNTVAWLAGRSDGENYGKLRAYRFPTADLVYGPAQIEARIDQHPSISAQLTLWNQSGSQVIRGNLLMIPIGSSFLFVEPVYLQAENSRLPELKRVIVATGNNIAMEQTLPIALDVLFGRRPSSLSGPDTIPQVTPAPASPGATPTPAAASGARPLPTDVPGLLRDAQDTSQQVQRDLDRLRQLLEELQRRQAPTATPTPTR